jgi:hypothetical protein
MRMALEMPPLQRKERDREKPVYSDAMINFSTALIC